jgi:hypothetical protein
MMNVVARNDEVVLVVSGHTLPITGCASAIEGDVLVVSHSGAPSLRVGASCCVTFYRQGRNALFLTEVVGRGPGCVRLRLPSMLLQEQRRTTRVRVSPGSGLRASVSANQHRWEPRVVDLSTGGARLAFPEDDLPDWGVGTMVRLDLAMGIDVSATLVAVVVRRKDCEYGLTFEVGGYGRQARAQVGLGRLIEALGRA